MNSWLVFALGIIVGALGLAAWAIWADTRPQKSAFERGAWWERPEG